MKRWLLVVMALALLLAGGAAFASPGGIPQVPEASALILAPVGIAAIIAAEHRRRRLAKLKSGVGRAYYLGKRFIDLVLSSSVLLIASPVMAIIAVFVSIDSPGAVFFKRRVVGQGANRFDMYKFRSMVEGAESILEQDSELREQYYVKCKLESDPRITRLGKFLRATSLDELPQLINIFLGDMTFVGPRPIAEDEMEIYGSAFEVFTTVRPGITGIWQTCGRSDTSYEKRVEMDMLYIENRSLLLDLWIIASTVPAVLLKRGAC